MNNEQKKRGGIASLNIGIFVCICGFFSLTNII